MCELLPEASKAVPAFCGAKYSCNEFSDLAGFLREEKRKFKLFFGYEEVCKEQRYTNHVPEDETISQSRNAKTVRTSETHRNCLYEMFSLDNPRNDTGTRCLKF